METRREARVVADEDVKRADVRRAAKVTVVGRRKRAVRIAIVVVVVVVGLGLGFLGERVVRGVVWGGAKIDRRRCRSQVARCSNTQTSVCGCGQTRSVTAGCKLNCKQTTSVFLGDIFKSLNKKRKMVVRRKGVERAAFVEAGGKIPCENLSGDHSAWGILVRIHVIYRSRKVFRGFWQIGGFDRFLTDFLEDRMYASIHYSKRLYCLRSCYISTRKRQ
jgi:hypothetical protein